MENKIGNNLEFWAKNSKLEKRLEIKFLTIGKKFEFGKKFKFRKNLKIGKKILKFGEKKFENWKKFLNLETDLISGKANWKFWGQIGNLQKIWGKKLEFWKKLGNLENTQDLSL